MQQLKVSSICFLVIAVAYAAASPVDSVVPEDSLYELNDELDEARQTVADMKSAGNSDEACRKLVKETIDDITTTVTTDQKTIDELPRGEQCMELGQTTVKTATEAKVIADKRVITCERQVKETNEASVDFGWYTYSSLTPGQCGSFFSSIAYTTAKTKHSTAVKSHQIAVGAAAEASVTLKTSISTASKLRHECICKTRTDHEKAYKDKSKANAANAKAWVKAHKIECVLDHKSKCRIPPVPRLKAVKLSSAVMEEACPVKQVDPVVKQVVKHEVKKAVAKKLPLLHRL